METFAPKGKIFGPILPQFILEKRITLGAKVMYALLCNYASEKDHCWPSHATLASRLSCSISSVKNYLAELVRENLIAIRKEHYRSSVYYLIRPEHNNNADESNSERSERVFTCNKSSSGYINNFNKQKQEKTPPFPPKRQKRLRSLRLSLRLRRGVGFLLNRILKTYGISIPKKRQKASPGLPGSVWPVAVSFLPYLNFTPLFSIAWLRKAGTGNRDDSSPSLETGFAGSDGSMLFLPALLRDGGLIPACKRPCRKERNKKNASRNGRKRKKKDCVLSSGHLRKNLTLPSTRPWLSASGCICTPFTALPLPKMFLRITPGALWPFFLSTVGKYRNDAIRPPLPTCRRRFPIFTARNCCSAEIPNPQPYRHTHKELP